MMSAKASNALEGPEAHMMICGAGGREVCGAMRSSAGKAANQVSSSTLHESGDLRRARFLRKKTGKNILEFRDAVEQDRRLKIDAQSVYGSHDALFDHC